MFFTKKRFGKITTPNALQSTLSRRLQGIFIYPIGLSYGVFYWELYRTLTKYQILL